MPEPFRHFSHGELERLKNFALDHGLAANRTALMFNLPHQIVNMAVGGANAAAQLSIDLPSLNQISQTTDGTIPIKIWLENSRALIVDAQALKLLDSFLNQLDSPPPPNTLDETARRLVGEIEQERVFNKSDLLSVSFIERAAKVARSTFYLSVPVYINGVPQTQAGNEDEPLTFSGTGWLIGKGLLITNHHVIKARNEGGDVTDDGLRLQAHHMKIHGNYLNSGEKGDFVTAGKLLVWSTRLDYAIIRVEGLDDHYVLPRRTGGLDFTEENYEAANIIQHPEGKSKKIALRNNLIVRSDETHLAYFTDTEFGSSGSPVADDNWRVIALHAGFAKSDRSPILYQGSLEKEVNLGIRIDAILDDIREQDIDIADEIERD